MVKKSKKRKVKVVRSRTGKVLNSWQAGYAAWRRNVKDWMEAERGRGGELAAVLGVHKRNVSDWFGTGRNDAPAWAVFAVQRSVILGDPLNPVGSVESRKECAE